MKPDCRRFVNLGPGDKEFLQAEEEHAQQKDQPVKKTDAEVREERVSCLQTCDEGLGREGNRGQRCTAELEGGLARVTGKSL